MTENTMRMRADGKKLGGHNSYPRSGWVEVTARQRKTQQYTLADRRDAARVDYADAAVEYRRQK